MAELAQRIDARRDGPAYDQDWAAWVWHQVELIKARRFEELDIENLADEVGSLARSDFKGWVSAIRLVLMHLLKWEHQPARRTRSWELTIRVQRNVVLRNLKDSPSYKARIQEAVDLAYEDARLAASAETGLALQTFAETCPYDWATITVGVLALPSDDA